MDQKRILLIDDDRELCMEMLSILADSGYRVVVANNGMEGKKIIENECFDVIILDLKMPVMNGFEFIKNFPKKELLSRLIVLSGSLMSENDLHEPKYTNISQNEKRELVESCSAIFTKPFDITVLLSKIKEIIYENNSFNC